MPTIAPIRGPQIPARADDDVGRELALVGDDGRGPGRRRCGCRSRCARRGTRAPPLDRPAGLRLARPGPPWPARRSGRGSRPARRSGRAAARAATHSSGSSSRALDAPTTGPSRGAGAGRPAAPGSCATSRPPTWSEAPPPVERRARCTSRPCTWRTRSSSSTRWSGTRARGVRASSRRRRTAAPGRRTVTSVQPRGDELVGERRSPRSRPR